MLNPDTVIDDLDNLTKMVDYMEAHRKVGIAGCRLVNPDGTWQKSIGHYSSLLSGFAEQTGLNHIVHASPVLRKLGKSLAGTFTKSLSHFNESSHTGSKPVEVDFVWGAYLMFRAEVARDIGWLDEAFFIFAEESDFCFRARETGWSIQFVPVTSIVHVGGQSRKQNFAKMYYWHIAVYFWFFVKHNRWKGVVWKAGTLCIQMTLWTGAAIAGNRLSQLIHRQLLHLCLSPLTGRPELLRLGWERINQYSDDRT
jgi:GT2 family glycosyltransferase